MEAGMLEQVEDIRNRMNSRMDGGPGSGNWGHVGRPGERGGSEAGGGNAFRLLKTSAMKYTSQAKMRDDAKKAYTAAQKSGNAKAIARAKKHMSGINMNVKSADKSKAGKAGYHVVKNIDVNASRNILKDPNRGTRARESTVSKIKGTREGVRFAFPKRITRGGDKSRKGKTNEKRSAV